MSHGLETRVPFLDNDLVDFAMSCPVGLKLNNLDDVVQIDENDSRDKGRVYFEKTQDGKQILRDVMRKYIPEDITSAVKQGFSAPDGSWFKGESIDYVRNTLLEGSPRIFEYLNRDVVIEMVDEHLEGKQNRRLFIWSLLNVEAWLNQEIEGP